MSRQFQIVAKPAARPARLLSPTPFGILQRKCACGGSGSAGGGCEECKKKAVSLQRFVASEAPSVGIPPIVKQVLNSPGQPLDRETRAFFEPRFGHDFSRVRVHADDKAAASARSLGALAYTVGRHMVFAPGEYATGGERGRKLIAHELTHTLQQGLGTVAPSSFGRSQAGDVWEKEADDVANRLDHSKPGGMKPNIRAERAVPPLQRKVQLTGAASALNKVINLINRAIDIRFKAEIDAGGNISIKSSGLSGPPTLEQQEFTDRLRAVVDDPKLVKEGVTEGGIPIVGSFNLQQIDIDDMLALGAGQPGWAAAGALIHEFTEQREKQVKGQAFPPAHATATAAELAVVGAQTIESDVPSFTPNTDGTVSGTRTTVLKYPDGTRWKMIVTVSHNNITDVKRQKLP